MESFWGHDSTHTTEGCKTGNNGARWLCYQVPAAFRREGSHGEQHVWLSVLTAMPLGGETQDGGDTNNNTHRLLSGSSVLGTERNVSWGSPPFTRPVVLQWSHFSHLRPYLKNTCGAENRAEVLTSSFLKSRIRGKQVLRFPLLHPLLSLSLEWSPLSSAVCCILISFVILKLHCCHLPVRAIAR